MSKVIFPEFEPLAKGTREGSQQQQNDFSADFTFAFPPHASCCSGKAKTQCLLPPSLDICSAGLRAKATYYINALACRPGLLKRTLRATTQLRYQPPPALHPPTHTRVEETDSTPRPEFVQTVAKLPASRLGWPDNRPCLTSTGRLPAYLTLEVLMPYPATLCLGRDTCLQILIHAGSNMLDVVGPLQLRSATTRLRRTTTSRAGGAAVRTDVAYRSLWHSEGAVPIVCEKLKVDCGVWQNSGGLLGINTLSFDSCAVSREYAVEVVLGITSRLQPLTQVWNEDPRSKWLSVKLGAIAHAPRSSTLLPLSTSSSWILRPITPTRGGCRTRRMSGL